MKNSSKAKVHFMGIGGSGISAVAQIAKSEGFEVTGCDISTDTPYLAKVKNLNIPTFTGHSKSHLKDVDILAVTPAVFYQNNSHPEVDLARKKGILFKWQDFLGQFLHKNKFLICIAGTHGKSTTTAMVGHMLYDAGLRPTVEVGATDLKWNNNVLLGQGKYFVSEADEFHNNFASYHPDIVILNNIEMDHPEYFHTLDNLINTYKNFVQNIKPGGFLIYNADDSGNHRLVSTLGQTNFKIIPFYPSKSRKINLSVPGVHNQTNACGALELARVLKISSKISRRSLHNFQGLARRIELLGSKKGIKVYDDYANHPTAFAATLEAVKSLNPNSRIITIIEPHTVSRLRATIDQIGKALKLSQITIVTEIFLGREQKDSSFTGQNIASAIKNGIHIASFDDVQSYLKTTLKKDDVVIVMGSGNSYKLARQIFNSI